MKSEKTVNDMLKSIMLGGGYSYTASSVLGNLNAGYYISDLNGYAIKIRRYDIARPFPLPVV